VVAEIISFDEEEVKNNIIYFLDSAQTKLKIINASNLLYLNNDMENC